MCLLQGQMLAKSKVIIFFFFFPAEIFFYKFCREKCPYSDGFDFSLSLSTMNSVTVLETMQVKVQLGCTAPFFSQTHTLFLPL